MKVAVVGLLCGLVSTAHAIEEPETWSGGDYVGATATGVVTSGVFLVGGVMSGVGFARLTSTDDNWGALGLGLLFGAAGGIVGGMVGPHIYANTFDRPVGNAWAAPLGYASGLLLAIGVLSFTHDGDSSYLQGLTTASVIVLPPMGAAIGYGLTAERARDSTARLTAPTPWISTGPEGRVFGLRLASGTF